ncbi:MAG TPA: hypothetical protein VKH15_12815, partial [Candidatus Acidoferrum sp.]|nr:hypothetical protein [Candidatus Acidoferrum sp.]
SHIPGVAEVAFPASNTPHAPSGQSRQQRRRIERNVRGKNGKPDFHLLGSRSDTGRAGLETAELLSLNGLARKLIHNFALYSLDKILLQAYK